jgi:hypothetical protein
MCKLKAMNNHLILLVIVLITSCINTKDEHKKAKQIELEKQEVLPDCIHQKDTILGSHFVINYIVKKDFFDVKVKIRNIDTLLGYKFDCSTPGVLVPTYYNHSQNSLLLTRGQSNNFREMIVCSLINNKISIRKFESERSMNADYDFAYKFSDNDTFLILSSHNDSLKKRHIKMPHKISTDSIILIRITRDHIIITTENKTKTRIYL